MVDPLFFTANQLTLRQLIEACEEVDGLVWDEGAGELVVQGAGTVPHLAEGELGFVADSSFLPALEMVFQGVVIVPLEVEIAVRPEVTIIRAENPYKVFVSMLGQLYGDVTRAQYTFAEDKPSTQGVGCDISSSARFGINVSIGNDVIIGANSVIGRGVKIGHGTVIGDNVSIYATFIGNHCCIHAGTRIGNEGFGFIPTGKTPLKIPQLGRVILQDNVEIGANCTIDRGTLDDTIIGENTKIDNQVQVAHNVEIGLNCQISAQTGIAGSSVIGNNVLLGGRVGIVNKAVLGDKSMVMACALVTKDVAENAVVAGAPATDIKIWRKEIAALRKQARDKG